ncbi:UNVERIFIED_CONTAM: ribonuclease HIII [Streptococcus canis]|uniref:ribonuclease HIII n=1 Tax=Streptococcus canis TaxID=1329 RepID=UPI000B8B4D9C|nr:ribonuclease HIII [Streptococcus canis]MDW7797567.1 ribonuclease HIII [Streptococcus canis]QJD12963.1 ribonuclease HIII [Streptococcus canis]QKG74398.1 ribonuclease HIII [Streptococcus canis]QKG78231.1 ribonuclease HIII [Streptococcus canis]VTR80628.1 ribonuclease HIII [Streptococcus canis]
MNTLVLKIDAQLSQTLKAQLGADQISNKNPYVAFAAKKNGVTVLLYTSGKLVLQGSSADALAQELGLPIADSSPEKPTSEQNIPMIGSDEVGNGSYFGGIAVVASFVRPEDHAFLKKLGVDDSKTLTDQTIRKIAPLLEEKIPHKSLLLSPKKYNDRVGKGKAYNAVSVKVALHNQAIFLLLQTGVSPEKIVIDAFTSQTNYEKHLQKEKNHFSNPLTFQEKAESLYLAVAVSSIIARNLFLENLDQLSQELGYRLPSGAGQASDKVASQLLAAYGMSSLAHSAKLHFANTQKAQALLTKQK